MKCPVCNGEGYVYEHITYQGQIEPSEITREICYKCNGTGKVDEPMTNEEWFNSLTTEEKADFFCTVQNCLTIYGEHIATHEDWVKWLKQPHKE